MSWDPQWWLVTVALLGLAASLALGRGRMPWQRALALVLLAVVALQPGVTPREAPAGARYNLLLMVDRTTSMGAKDWDGERPRTEGVAADVAQLLQNHPGARVAVVTFDNEARVAVPWTTDTLAVDSFITTMGWREEGYASGSDISVGVDTARELLESAETDLPGLPRVLVYLGDGEQTAPSEPSSFAGLRDLVDQAVVLGYGTSEGGQMETYPGSGELVERDGVPQVSRINEDALRKAADELGGRYENRATQAPLDGLDQLGRGGSGQPSHPWLVLTLSALVAVLVLWDLTATALRTRRAAQEVES